MDERNDRKDAIQILVIHCNHPSLSFHTRSNLNLIEPRPLVARITFTDKRFITTTDYFSNIWEELQFMSMATHSSFDSCFLVLQQASTEGMQVSVIP